jgi:hypothetical protein
MSHRVEVFDCTYFRTKFQESKGLCLKCRAAFYRPLHEARTQAWGKGAEMKKVRPGGSGSPAGYGEASRRIGDERAT